MLKSFSSSLIKTTLLCGAIIVAAGAGQASQYFHSANDLQTVAMAEWAGDDLQRQSMVEAFTQECLIGKVQANTSIADSIAEPHISVMACAESNCFNELASIVVGAADDLKSFPWPLSLVAANNL